jgi:hypothetical protein
MKRRWLLSAALYAALFALGCEPSLGAMPALCGADGACPEGLDCIHGVCAEPGTPVPITVAKVGSIRGPDVRMVSQANSVLVAWQSYPYFAEGQKFVGARVSPDGTVSQRMDLVGRFVAEDDSLEPYFDMLPVPGDRLLVAISAPSLPDDPSVKPRLITYRVDLPSEGKESSPPAYEAAWGQEQRLDTVGYGAVSLPKLVDRGTSVEVGYVRSRTTAMATVADLSIFSMQQDGTLSAPDANYHSVRSNLSVAVGVFDALRFSTGTWWVLDDERPSALYLLDAGGKTEAVLGRLAVPVAVDGSSLLYIEPSARQGDKLATSEVSGDAELRKVTVVDTGGSLQASETTLGKMPMIRDFPRPAWFAREGKPAILATPGADAFNSKLLVYTVDPQTGATNLIHEIERYSQRLIEAVRVLVIGDKLFVAWLETDAENGAIRMAILPEP